jgi:hypothetical protein
MSCDEDVDGYTVNLANFVSLVSLVDFAASLSHRKKRRAKVSSVCQGASGGSFPKLFCHIYEEPFCVCLMDLSLTINRS